MPSNITLGAKQLVDEAKAAIEEIPAAEAIKLVNDPNVVIVDLRDPRELHLEGKIPGSFHAPRGMLEFWIDPATPYFKPVFGEDKKFVFHCAAGARSALAAYTAQRMGLKPVAHIIGGMGAWKAAGGPVEMPDPDKKL
jgi:rhodanese-related sulfurtransferase